MSAYHEQKTSINDADVLCESLKEIGVKEVQKHDTPVALEGYHGDKRKETAEIVIPRRVVGSASNDIGFKRGEDGNFKAIISSFDSSRHGKKWLADLTKTYVEKKAMKSARNAGLTFVGRTVTKTGSVKLNFTKA
jgi:hypothetical protein